jgi:hypothetical protein
MTDLELIKLLSLVEGKSRAGSISWEKTAEPHAFQTTIAGYILKAEERPDPDNPFEPDFVLDVINNMNETIESIYRWSIKELPSDFNPHAVLKNIHVAARRSAMGADAALNTITASLEKL